MTTGATSDSNRVGAIARGLGWGMATGLLVALIDVADTVLAGFDGQVGYLVWYAASSLVLTFGALGAALGAWTSAVLWLTRHSPRRIAPVLRALALGLPGAAFVAWVPTSWIMEHWSALETRGKAIAIAVYAVALLGSALIAAVAYWICARYRAAQPRLPRFHLTLLTAVIALTAGSYWADRRVLVDLYDDFHYGLSGAFVAGSAVALMLASRSAATPLSALVRLLPRSLGPRSIGAGTLALALGSLTLLEQRSPDVFGPSSSVIFAKLVGTVRTWSDFDDDGSSSLFGGSDCAPFNPEVQPGKFDMPGNELDEDCSGTVAEWPKPEPEPTYPVPDRAGYNLLMITIDALRADHLGAFGYTTNRTSPNIDRLAERSIRFTEAFSPSPKTYDTMPCLATGLYPSNVPRDYRVKVPKGERKKHYLYRVTEEVELLSETLQKRGYLTAAAHGVGILRSMGLSRGFDEYKVTRQATETATDFLQRKVMGAEPPRPFFMWLHYYSPHHPYDKREGFDFGDDDVARYDSEIAFDDHQIGLLLDELDRLGLSERTIVILTADHGEEFRDHEGTMHGLRLYRELTRVPLLLRIPGVEPGTVGVPVELADVVPTVCDVLQLGDACSDHDGHSLLAAVAGKRNPERGAYSELYRRGDTLLMNALTTDKWRMLYNYKRDRAELYDAVNDRSEQHNVAGQHPELIQQFRDRLATRTLYRQGQVFQRYEATGDSLILAEALPVFRRHQMLSLALERIGQDLSPRHLPHLKELSKRPGLNPSLKRLTKQLLGRIEKPGVN